MSEAQHLAEALTRHFAGSTPTGAFLPFEAATEGLTAAQAAAVPAPRFNSIWAIVNHVWFWQEVLMRLLQNQPASHELLGTPDGSGWAPAGDPVDEAAWQADRKRALEVNTSLAAVVARLSEAELVETLEAWRSPKHQAIQGIVAHNSYHTCEIISVRHMQGLWLERA
jgi:hypothetical protein